SFLLKYFFRHVCRGGMRYGVVHMQQIEIIVLDHIHHGACQSRFIWRIIEQGIGWHLHFVIENIRKKSIQPDWLLVSDEMYKVTFLRQGLAQFCSQDATATKCGITNNAYSHEKYSDDNPKVTDLWQEGSNDN